MFCLPQSFGTQKILSALSLAEVKKGAIMRFLYLKLIKFHDEIYFLLTNNLGPNRSCDLKKKMIFKGHWIFFTNFSFLIF